jgi:acetyl esterase/lipase
VVVLKRVVAMFVLRVGVMAIVIVSNPLRLARTMGRELLAGFFTPPLLAGVVAAGLAGSKEPEGRVLRFVPRQVQEAMRESRIAWIMYSQFEYVAAGLAVLALAPGRARSLLHVQRSGPDHKDIQCGNVPGSCCDVYLPRAYSSNELLLFVPGGAWSHGYKSFYTLTSRRLADELACAVAVVGYDLFPVVNGAAQVEQVEQAIRWAESGASVPGVGPLLRKGGRLVIVGHSAGGQLAAAALLSRSSDVRDDLAAASVDALALLSAPLELRRHVGHEARRGVATISALSAAFVGDDGRTFIEGDQASVPLDDGESAPGVARLRLFDDSQPMARLSPECIVRADRSSALAKLPRTIALFHGEHDPTVPASSTRRFEAALGCDDGTVMAEYANCSHVDYILDLVTMPPEAERAPPLLTFLRATCFPNAERTSSTREK